MDVDFRNGFNVVLAERAEDSGSKASRNGLGKSLLVQIINFCLCGDPSETLQKEEMQKWVFTLELEHDGEIFKFTRRVESDSTLRISGNVKSLGIEVPNEKSEYVIDDMKTILGKAFFGLTIPTSDEKRVTPTYRALNSYFMRTSSTAFNDPFAYFANQKGPSKQVNNAFLLGLDWDLAAKFHQLKFKKEKLDEVNKAIENGTLDEFGGSVGELESKKIAEQAKLEVLETKIKNFKVHEQYKEMQQEADGFTQTIHDLLNKININKQLIRRYNTDLSAQETPEADVTEVYKEAGLVFGEKIVRSLDEIRQFHKNVINNRLDYLKYEIKRLKQEIIKYEAEVEELTSKRSNYLKLLESHGALEEYVLLQKDVSRQRSAVGDLEGRIKRLTEVSTEISRLNIEIEQLLTVIKKDYSERMVNLKAAIQMFNDNSEYLYERSGVLSVDFSKAGYQFKVKMEKSGSDGVGSMKVFCYDLMLAEYWSTIKGKPIPLVHDSKIWDGVDDRQIAKAMQLAHLKSEDLGFQYICTVNSHVVPYEEFEDDFRDTFEKSIILKYNDKDESGTLLGTIF